MTDGSEVITLIMAVACTTEMLVNLYETAQHNIPNGCHLHISIVRTFNLTQIIWFMVRDRVFVRIYHKTMRGCRGIQIKCHTFLFLHKTEASGQFFLTEKINPHTPMETETQCPVPVMLIFTNFTYLVCLVLLIYKCVLLRIKLTWPMSSPCDSTPLVWDVGDGCIKCWMPGWT